MRESREMIVRESKKKLGRESSERMYYMKVRKLEKKIRKRK